MKLPRKVTHVLWRLCKECLPTNAALYNIHVDVNPTCPWCHSAVETNLHAIFLCDFVLTMWHVVGLQSLVQCTEHETPKEVFDRVFHQGSKDQCLEVTMLCWSLWYCRNKWIWDRANGSIFGVRNTTNCLFREWAEAQAREENMKIGGKVGDRVWSKQSTGWVKINVDATVFIMGGIGVAAIIKDNQSAFVASRVMKLPGEWSPREAEALALKEVLSWVINRYMHCEFQTDCYALAASCNGSTGSSLFDTIVIDCIGLSKHINQVLFSFAFHYANNVAHVLAHAAYSMTDVGDWFVTPPNFLVRSLELDSII
ncbi:uncharacterized protein LOC141664429 [Apium graveolens]|uniref:uncharacterized protein LOC141664429 n=1 Tax=Apium graveolens TaxID=4045 RepID=UPI003D7AD86C